MKRRNCWLGYNNRDFSRPATLKPEIRVRADERSNTFLLFRSLSLSFLYVFICINSIDITLIVSGIDDGGDSGRLLTVDCDTHSAGWAGEASARAAAGIVDALAQRLQPIHVHNRRRYRDDDTHNGAH